MVNVELRLHPGVVFAYSPNHIELIIRAENPSDQDFWCEADVLVPEKLSLSPDNNLRKGRLRVGIVAKNEFIEKACRVYANIYTNPQVYRCKSIVYFYNKNGVIESRIEKTIDLRCEMKKSSTL